MYDIIQAYNKTRGTALLDQLKEKKPLFLCVIGVTETAKIQGISAAGENPEITDYTPPADVELLHLGKCKCIPGVPVTPDGIPTPALITMSALKLADIPTLVFSAGLKVKPHVPFVDLGGKPGRDIRTGRALDNAEEVLNRAKLAGENLAKTVDYLVIGESIPGGTTTALSVLLAMGVDAKGKVSSSMPLNPHGLKIKTVEEALEAAGAKFGDFADDPIKAVSTVGDPMQPALAGLVLGAAGRVPVIMAGGTQMAAVLAVVKASNPDVLDNVAVGTTRWILADKTADMKGLVAEIADVPLLAADMDFGRSRFDGLKAYEAGVVKEGVGCGGAAMAAMLKSNGKITKKVLLEEIENNYKQLVNTK
ncbi:MAG TPA: TIGR00303 family protein [Candidatus Bathyarchaeota archaeon]|nr:TIGR00303 family protein [Candidatus Bathyarchaeota archaeon]